MAARRLARSCRAAAALLALVVLVAACNGNAKDSIVKLIAAVKAQ